MTRLAILFAIFTACAAAAEPVKLSSPDGRRELSVAATNEDPRELDLRLVFLGVGSHQALIMEDGGDSDYRTHRESYQTRKQTVTSAGTLRVKLAPGGGACVLLQPTNEL